jgi:pimeloyl-ACP methyl ester carboxylesterase
MRLAESRSFSLGWNAECEDCAVLWSSVHGAGSPTVVFEAGGGEDSSVWADLEPKVRRRHEVRTMLYDRAGLGRSAPTPPPYHIDDEAEALRRELDRQGIAAPVVLVAHSYGGFVATLVAATDARIAGLVLVDANLASFFDEAQLQKVLDTYRPQYDALEQAAPDLARVMIPLMEAYPDTVNRLRRAEIPATMPIVDIVAEHTWLDAPADVRALRQAHRDFVAASPHREAVLAAASGHHVMHDQPDVVLEAVARIIAMVRSARSGASSGLG